MATHAESSPADTSLPTAASPPTEADRLADQLERSFRGGAWHGPSVLEALAGVDAAKARSRPLSGAHSIAEITGHVATWIDVARRRIAGEVSVRVGEDENFPPGAATTDDAWRATLGHLDKVHRGLLAAVRGLDEGGLEKPVSGSDPTVRGLILGVLQHNGYHAGQIVLLRKVAGEGAVP